MERYGIGPSEAERVDSISPRGRSVTPSRESLAHDEDRVSKAVSPPIGPPLDFEWIYYPNIPTARNELAGSEPAVMAMVHQVRSFHYLVWIAECSLPLHCQVEAETSTGARQQVQQIRNLIEWRELSAKELNDILANEQAGST